MPMADDFAVLPGMGAPCADVIKLGTDESPGRATIHRAGSPRKWDEREGYGFSGSSLVFIGSKLSEFDVHIYLWTELQHQLWTFFCEKWLAESPLGVRPTSIGIYHPILARLGISQVVVLDVLQPEEDDYGGWTWIIKFKKFRAPRAIAITKPLPGIPAATGPLAPPQNANQVVIQQLSAELKGP